MLSGPISLRLRFRAAESFSSVIGLILSFFWGGRLSGLFGVVRFYATEIGDLDVSIMPSPHLLLIVLVLVPASQMPSLAAELAPAHHKEIYVESRDPWVSANSNDVKSIARELVVHDNLRALAKSCGMTEEEAGKVSATLKWSKVAIFLNDIATPRPISKLSNRRFCGTLNNAGTDIPASSFCPAQTARNRLVI